MVTDVVPPQRRGRAMAIVMGSFSVSAVVAVPFGLEMARLGGKRYFSRVRTEFGTIPGIDIELSADDPGKMTQVGISEAEGESRD